MAKKDYSKWTKEDLIKELEKFKKQKKYGIVWEDKPEQVALMCKEKLPILTEEKSKEIITDKDKPTNILIEGDNYHALSVLNYTHKGKIDVIYIDPPYNTGARDWKYNNDYVDMNDQWRHSKWLSMMEKRLKLAKNLLKQDGVLICTIDDNELFAIGLLLDEIFGENNRIGIVCVEHNPQGRTFSKYLSTTHEYYLFYAKNIKNVEIQNLPISEDDNHNFLYNDGKSFYKRIPLQKSGFASRRKDRPTQFFPFYINEKTLELSLEEKKGWKKIIPINKFGEEGVWRNSFENCKKLLENDDIEVVKNGNKYTLYKKYRIHFGKKPTTYSIPFLLISYNL
ncbi:MAG: site-specific DNA-methyltransferase [Candidatus Aenigmarchaeota archaeon]|nr:site-specific DNA-methyltransferase [Candidatus Aenigmarchaeota archaeon]